jgi:hypothetical protein
MPYYVPEVDPVSNRNEYHEDFLQDEGGRCIGLTNLPPLGADFLEGWELQPATKLWVCPGLYRDCFTFTFTFDVCNFSTALLTDK